MHTVESADPAGHLSKITFDEKGLLPPEKRIPRVTQAIWQWEGGATGSLLHGVALHGESVGLRGILTSRGRL